MHDSRPIIVFDSGIGGLTIYRPLKIALPGENIVYINDPVGFPYGDKSLDWLTTRFIELGKQFQALNPKLVVLACNTATTNIIASIRRQLTCPVVGVEPVIKPLAHYDSSLALMTAASAASVSTAKLMAQYGQHIHVFTPHGLAAAIEYNDYDQVKKNLHEIKQLVQKYHIQAVGLSCTHYPLVIKLFPLALPQVIFIDPSEAVVAQVQRVLEL